MADVTQHGLHWGPSKHLRLARDLDERGWLLWMLVWFGSISLSAEKLSATSGMMCNIIAVCTMSRDTSST